MKKIFLMLAAGLVMTGAANAQDAVKADKKARHENRESRENRHGDRERKNPEEIASRQTAMLNKKLALSDKQQKKVQEISLKRAQETEALRSRLAASQEQERGRKAGAHQEMKAINDRWEAELKDILSKKQYAQYEASRQEMKNRRLAGDSERGEREGKRKEFKRQPKVNG
jgi:periplasmic protein CpxP/Spy